VTVGIIRQNVCVLRAALAAALPGSSAHDQAQNQPGWGGSAFDSSVELVLQLIAQMPSGRALPPGEPATERGGGQ
jgi:hypothetical protein